MRIRFIWADSANVTRKSRAAALLLCGAVLMLLGSAKFLVVDRPMVSDAILVLGGGPELRTAKAVQLLRAGYGKRILIDSEDTIPYLGITEADRLRTFVETVFPQAAAQIQVCPARGDSTQSEMADVLLACKDSRSARYWSLLRITTPGERYGFLTDICRSTAGRSQQSMTERVLT